MKLKSQGKEVAHTEKENGENKDQSVLSMDRRVRISRPNTANPMVPMTPKRKATIKFVSGLTCHRKAPPKAAMETNTSRMR